MSDSTTTTVFVHPRLTFRQELAKAAMQALIRYRAKPKDGEQPIVECDCEVAWRIADDMIAHENPPKQLGFPENG